jgi:hypothetical protein
LAIDIQWYQVITNLDRVTVGKIEIIHRERRVRGKSEDAQSQGRALKPGGLARIGEISSAKNLMEMLVELPNKFRGHSAPGMVANKIFQLVLLAGH